MRRLVLLFLVVGATLFASTAGSAQAGLFGGGCGLNAPVFTPWGDSANYYYATNGGFEWGSYGWTLGGGAGVVSHSNEPYYLGGYGSHALEIPAGGSASINVCYGLTYPGIRLFAQGEDGPARIHVRIVTHSLLGVLSVLDGGTFTANESWAPSPRVSSLCSALASLVGAKSMQLQFTVESGTAQIDDLFVDPFLSEA
jgi:hypothetical protein